jgi:hypothetical protein
LTEIAVEKNSTIIFPLPLDLIEPLLGVVKNRNNEVAREQFDGPSAASPTPAYRPYREDK